MHSWLRHKRYAADLVQPGTVTEVSRGVEATLTIDQPDSSATSCLFVLRESKPEGVWITRLLAHDPGVERRDSWVWLDVDAPSDEQRSDRRVRWTAPPRLVRDVLEVVDARDGGAAISPEPQIVTAPDVDALVDAVRDGRRRGPIFVAGSDQTLPVSRWRALVADYLRQSTGLAAGYVLDGDATVEFARRVGATHAVAPGTLRTFVADAAPGDALDGRRHPVLTTSRILRDSTHRLGRFLGGRVRDMTLTAPVPQALARVETRLLRQVDRDVLALVERETPARITPVSSKPGPDTIHLHDGLVQKGMGATATTAAPASAPSEPEPVSAETPVEEVAEATPSDRSSDPLVLGALSTVVSDVLGLDRVTPRAVHRLAEMVKSAATARSTWNSLVKRKSAQFEESQQYVTDLREQLADTSRRLEDEQAEHAETQEALTMHERDLKVVRLRLQAAGNGELAWAEPAGAEVGSSPPDSFDDLVARLGELEHVEWTGDDTIAIGLDTHDPLGRWSKKSWNALLALDDYARLRLSGEIEGSVDKYLQNTPAGRSGYSATRHARDESDGVKTTAKFSEPRMLHGPGDALVFMGAHFKIANSGTISPRMHYYDALSTEQRIYVGYLGPHLPSGKTN
ncbi:hypothetical protein [Myceligenerans cantabricum]